MISKKFWNSEGLGMSQTYLFESERLRTLEAHQLQQDTKQGFHKSLYLDPARNLCTVLFELLKNEFNIITL